MFDKLSWLINYESANEDIMFTKYSLIYILGIIYVVCL